MSFLTLSAPWTEALGLTLLHFLWQGLLIAVLYGAIDQLLDRRRAEARYLTATVALGLLLLAPVATFWWLSQPDASTTTPAVAPLLLPVDEVPAAWQPAAATPMAAESAGLPWLSFVVQIWSLGVLLFTLRLAGAWLATRRLRRRGRQLGDPLRDVLDELLESMGIRRRVELLFSRDVDVPTVIGWVTPAILVPAGALMGLTSFQMRAVLAHELAHVKRHDHLVNLVQMLAETLFFYHPAVWWVSHRLRIERENACDDAAVALCGDAVGYARTLAELEALRPAAPGLALAANGGSLFERVKRLVQPDSEPDSPWFPGSFFAAFIAVLTVLVPPLVANPGPQAETVVGPVELAPGDVDQTTAEELERARLYERIETHRAAGEKDPDMAVPQLLANLETSKGKDRETLLWTLGHVGDKSAVLPLVSALGDERGANRAKAAWSLGKVGDGRAVEPLIEVLQDDQPEVRKQAAWALGQIGDERSVEPLVNALMDGDLALRRTAAWALGMRGDERASKALDLAVRDGDRELRETAVWALGRTGGDSATQTLTELLEDPSPEIRRRAVWSLGTLGNEGSLGGITSALDDPETKVREQAAWALGMIGDERAKGALTSALDDPETKVRDRAAWALGRIQQEADAASTGPYDFFAEEPTGR